jgi:Na+:H+ antiporter, NhaA family
VKRDRLSAPSALAAIFGAVGGPIQRFFRLEAASGIVLLLAATLALIWANASGETYESAFNFRVAVGPAVRFTFRELVNDGLMTLFFFLVGMEIKRELLFGELRTFARATLPAVAAVGGMLAPALVYLAFNPKGPAVAGWGVAIATDIAFCIGVLALLQNRVPAGLVVFVTALAIFDDIGGIVVIAAFYGHGLDATWLGAAAVIAALLFAGARRSVQSWLFYAAGGGLLWYAVHRGGIHATIAGVVLGLAIPGRRAAGRSEAPLARFIERLHPFVAFGIMPGFALANSGVSLASVTVSDVASGVTIGIALGLVVGKLIGIFSFTLASVRLGFAPMPGEASVAKLLGASAVAGIGFTVALFIAALAFAEEPRLLTQAKLGIVLGSAIAGMLGAVILRSTAELHRAREAPRHA